MNSKNITATEGRLLSSFGSLTNSVVDTQEITQTIQKTEEKLSLKTGVVTKYYPHLDKAEVKLDQNKKKVVCKILHKYGGDIIDLYTPLAETRTYCTKLKEPCVIPRSKLHVVVLNISDADSKEHLLLGYYQNNELVGLNPAQPGNLKLTSVNDINQFWIKFGRDGLDLRLPSRAKTKVGTLNQNMKVVEYTATDSVYTKEQLDVIIKDYETRIKRLEEIIEQNHLTTTNTADNNTGNGGS